MQIFSKNKFVRMLKNILTEHTELLPFINYKQYICHMKTIEENIKVKEIDNVLIQLKDMSNIVQLSKLQGKIGMNAIIVKRLERENFIKVIRYENGDMDIQLTYEGYNLIKDGGYSFYDKRERNQKWKQRGWNAFCYILGIITTLIGQCVLHQLIHLI